MREVKAGKGGTVKAGRGKGRWQTFGVPDGLPAPVVLALLQDRTGDLWLGTFGGGVVRYNGERFTTFTTQEGLADNFVLAMLEDRAGCLWFGTAGGLSRYDERVVGQPGGLTVKGKGQPGGLTGEGTFTTFTTKDGLTHNGVGAIWEDRAGDLWLGTQRGVTRYDGATFTPFTTTDSLADSIVTSILQDRVGCFWFGTYGKGVVRYDGEQFVTFTTQEGLANNRVHTILEDRMGRLWFGTFEGVTRYDEGGGVFTTFTTKDGLAHNLVRAILEDRTGHLWFGTWEGVSWYDERGGQPGELTVESGGGQPGELTVAGTFTTFTTKDGIGDNDVRAILEDRAGYLWFGTSSGVSQYDERFTTFTMADGLPDKLVLSVCEDRMGCLWFGTQSGVTRYDEEGGGSAAPGGHPADGGGVGQPGGLTEEGTFTTFTTKDGLAINYVRAVLEDRAGCLWFGSAWGDVGGVTRYDTVEGTFTVFTTKDGLAHNGVGAILEDQAGHLWFGTGGGVSRYDEGGGRATPRPGGSRHPAPGGLTGKGTFTTFTADDGLAHNVVNAILEDRLGRLWFGTNGGVSRYDEEGGGSAAPGGHPADGGEVGQPGGLTGKGVWTTFTVKDGLAHDEVFTILENRKGQLWFGTKGGVSRYDEGGGEFITFTTKDGLVHNQVISMLEDRAGHLWFGTWGGGISLYDGLVFQTLLQRDGLAHNSIQQKILQTRNGDIWITTEGGVTRYRSCPTPPAVRLTEVVADQRYDPATEIHVPASQRLLAFEFRGRSFTTRPEQLAYVYRLEGYDRGWRWIRERRVEYVDLPLGEYRFQVKAVDQELNDSEMAEVRVMVVPDPRIVGLTEALRAGGVSGEFVGKSLALQQLLAQVHEVAQTDLTVLILGETGTGKGLVVRAIHGLSARREGPFIQVNCGTIPEGLVESELFGHEKGAFTGAVTRKLGRVELAEGGTFFLDEIGDLALATQVKLLRFLEERTFERVGGERTLRGNVRVIAATNRELRRMVAEGQFREDLYFRLLEFSIRVPPLRERLEDIPLLVRYFAERFARHLRRPVPGITAVALKRLQRYPWPGNVRELEHLVQRAVLSCREDIIGLDDVSWVLVEEREPSKHRVFVPLEEYERRYLEEVLEATGWVIYGPQGAAQILGIDPEKLRGRMRRYGLRRPR